MLSPKYFAFLLFGLIISELSVVNVNGGLCEGICEGKPGNAGLFSGDWFSLCGRSDREEIEPPKIRSKNQSGKVSPKESVATDKVQSNSSPVSTKPPQINITNVSQVSSLAKETVKNDNRDNRGVTSEKTVTIQTSKSKPLPPKENPAISKASENNSPDQQKDSSQTPKVTNTIPQVTKGPSTSSTPPKVPSVQSTTPICSPQVLGTRPKIIPVQQKAPIQTTTDPIQLKTSSSNPPRQKSPQIPSRVTIPLIYVPVNQQKTTPSIPPKTTPSVLRSTLPQEKIVETNFNKAVDAAKKFRKSPTYGDLQELYALYQQAVVGDNNTPVPRGFQFERMHYWSAWLRKKGMSQMEAKEKYARKVQDLTLSIGLLRY